MMLPEELMAPPGPAPGAPAAGGPPPELLAALAGGAPAGPPAPPPGAPPMPAEPAPEGGSEMSASDHLDKAIEHAQAALVSEPDDGDSEGLAKVVQTLYKIKATRQKEEDQVFGNAPVLKALRRGGNSSGY